jgi:tetratricopeptide (TPR) repeat protein
MKRYLLLLLFLVPGIVPGVLAHMSPDHSLRLVEIKLNDKPNDVSLLLEKARLLIIMREWDNAEAALRQIDEVEKERGVDTLYAYILLYHKRGDLKHAFELSNTGIRQFPENDLQWEIRGSICNDLGKTEEAIDAMSQSLRYRKTVHPLSYIQIATILLGRNHAGDKERTLALLREGIARVDHPSELLHLSIRLNAELERYDQALEDVNKLEMQYGKQVPFAAKRAEVLEKAGRNAEAVKAYRSAIALLETLPEKKQNKQVMHLKEVFQVAVDELSELPDAQYVVEREWGP